MNCHPNPTLQRRGKGSGSPSKGDVCGPPLPHHLLEGDGCDTVQPSGVRKLPASPACLSICANGIQCDFKSV